MQSGELLVSENFILVAFNIILTILNYQMLIIPHIVSCDRFFIRMIAWQWKWSKYSSSFNFMLLLIFVLKRVFKRQFCSGIFVSWELRNCIWTLIFFTLKLHLLIHYVPESRAHCTVRWRNRCLIDQILVPTRNQQSNLLMFIIDMAGPSCLSSWLNGWFVRSQVGILLISRLFCLFSFHLIWLNQICLTLRLC